MVNVLKAFVYLKDLHVDILGNAEAMCLLCTTDHGVKLSTFHPILGFGLGKINLTMNYILRSRKSPHWHTTELSKEVVLLMTAVRQDAEQTGRLDIGKFADTTTVLECLEGL